MTEKGKKIMPLLDEIYKSVIALRKPPHYSVPPEAALRARKLWVDNLFRNVGKLEGSREDIERMFEEK